MYTICSIHVWIGICTNICIKYIYICICVYIYNVYNINVLSYTSSTSTTKANREHLQESSISFSQIQPPKNHHSPVCKTHGFTINDYQFSSSYMYLSSMVHIPYPPVIYITAIENGPLIPGLPIKDCDFP